MQPGVAPRKIRLILNWFIRSISCFVFWQSHRLSIPGSSSSVVYWVCLVNYNHRLRKKFYVSFLHTLILTLTEHLAYPGNSCSACDRRWSSAAWSQWHGRPPRLLARHGHATPWRTPETGRGYHGGSGGKGRSGGVCHVPRKLPCLEGE